MPILRIRDENGKFIPINAIKGDDGKSAYEQAQEGGYKGTEEEFIAILNGLTNTEDANHYVDYNNPHKVSTSQIGAIPAQYSFPKDLDTELRQGVNKMSVCGYHSSTLNSPYKQNVSPRTHGMVITNCASEEYAAQMALPSGEDAIYVRQLYAGEVSDWVRIMDERQLIEHVAAVSLHNQASSGGGALGEGAKTADGAAIGLYAETMDDNGSLLNAIQLGNGRNKVAGTFQVYSYQMMDALGKIPNDRLNSDIPRIAIGSYRGTGTHGTKYPNTLTFDFVPKFVFVSKRGNSNFNSGATFLWVNPATTMNFCNNGSNYWCYPTLTDKTLSWYNAESSSYQLNNSNYDYDYLAWG